MDKHYVYKTEGGVCASEICFDLVDGIILNAEIVGGCKGNTAGVATLVEGMAAEDVILRLKGIDCQDGRSCPDEFARAVEQCLSEISEEEK